MIGSIIVFLLVLILSLPQIGSTCVWYPPLGGTTNPALALFQAAGLGAILGGLLVLYWKTAKKPSESEMEEGGLEEGGESEV